MRHRTALYAAVILVASAYGVGLSALTGQQAAAQVDLTGNWDASYSLSCTAAFEQSGDELSALMDCGGDLAGTLEGTIDQADGSFTLAGYLGVIPVELTGTVSADRSAVSGSWAAPPLVPSGTFSGTREDATPGGGDLTGEWLITVGEVFSGSCVVTVEHSGTHLSAALDCEPARTVSLEGTFDASNGSILLSGPLTDFAQLSLEGTVSADGNSINGTWEIDPSGEAGTLVATRQSGSALSPTPGASATPASTPTPTSAAEPTATATTAPASLPPTGSGAGPSGHASGLDWGAAALAGAAVAGSAAWYMRRRRLT